MNPSAPLVEIVATSIFSSSGIWAVLQTVMTRRERKEKARNDQTKAENDELEKLKRERENEQWLGDAQVKVQRAALDSANSRYAALHDDYTAVRNEMKAVRAATGLTIEALSSVLDKFLPTDTGDTFSAVMKRGEMNNVRKTIGQARSQLY